MESFKNTIAALITRRNRDYADSLSMPSGLWQNWLRKLTFVMDLHDDHLRDIRLHVGMGFFIGAPWSRVYYEANELKLGLRTPENSTFIRDYQRLTNGLPPALHLSELDPVGAEIGIDYQGRIITEDVLRAQSAVANLSRLPKFTSCIEIGAGYGALANQIIRAFGVERYTVIDYPEILFYVAVWAKIVQPNLNIVIFDGSNHDAAARAQLLLVPNFLQPEITLEADLLINENSFCEMSEAQVTSYLDSPQLRFRHLYSNNRDRQFMNQHLGGLNRLLADRYTLAPSPEVYADFYQNTPDDQRWNMKYIFLGSKTAPVSLDIHQLHGLTIRTQH